MIWQDAERLARAVHEDFTLDDAWTDDVVRWLSEREDPSAPVLIGRLPERRPVAAGKPAAYRIEKRLALILKRLGYSRRAALRERSQRPLIGDDGTDGTERDGSGHVFRPAEIPLKNRVFTCNGTDGTVELLFGR